MCVYGGVEDEETENHQVNSVFFHDLFAFDMERKWWFRLNLKKRAGEGRRRKKGSHDDDNAVEGKEDSMEVSDYDDQELEVEATSNGYEELI